MSSENIKKPWDRPLSTEEMIEQASNWNLAGDVGLLKHLEAFSNNLFAKCEETNNNLDKLLDNLDKASLQLDTVKSEFFSLHNTQFLESRVYEDDETLINEDEQKKVEVEVESDESRKKSMKEALSKGLEVLDKYFDKIEVSVSDSEEDDSNFLNYIYQAKDLYADRPLPYVIGSEEWYKNEHVGLEETSSESNTDEISEKFSESDSESELPVTDRLQARITSESSSLDDYSTDKIIPEQKMEENNVSSSIMPQVPDANTLFAEQLVAKLDNVIEQEINTRPIQKSTPAATNRFIGGLFSDEPPPLDIPEDDIFNKKVEKGIFSGGKGLFDDDEDDEVYFEQKISSNKKQIQDDLFTTADKTEQKKIVISSLFDDDDDEDDVNYDDLFTTVKNQTKTPYLKTLKPTPPIFDEEPPNLDSKTTKSIENKETIEENKSLDNKETIEKEINKKTIEENKPIKKVSLFDDDDNLFEDDLFSTVSTKKFSSDLFNTESLGDDLFTPSEIIPETNEDHVVVTNEDQVVVSNDELFVQSDRTSKLPFMDTTPPPDTNIWDSKSEDDLFGSEYLTRDVNDFGGSVHLFDDEPMPFLPSETNNDSQLNKTNDIPQFNKTNDSQFNKTNDDFCDNKIENSHVDEETKEYLNKTNVDKKVSLFSDYDDEDDRDWLLPDSPDTEKLSKISVKNDDKQLKSDEIIKKSPPPTPVKEISNKDITTVKTSPGKLKHNLNINVNALMPGSAPPKKKDMVKSHSLEIAGSETDSVITVSVSDVDISKKKTNEEQSQSSPTIETLHSYTKNRVRIPTKRRPSTRRARKELIEKTKEKSPSPPLDEDTVKKIDNVITSEAQKVSTDTEIQEIVTEVAQNYLHHQDKLKTTKQKTNEIHLFSESDDDDLFSSTKQMTNKKIPVKVESLFDSPDSDNDLFFSATSKNKTDLSVDEFSVERRPSVVKSDDFSSPTFDKPELFDDDVDDIFSTKKLPPKSDMLKKSLFDDELDDDDDIFGTPVMKNIDANKMVAPVAVPVEKKNPKSSNLRKLTNEDILDDPLDALKK